MHILLVEVDGVIVYVIATKYMTSLILENEGSDFVVIFVLPIPFH